VTCVSCDACQFLGYSFRSGTSQFSVGDSHGKFVVEEEYKKSACEDLTCDLKTLCVLRRLVWSDCKLCGTAIVL
jgi:hypothetical protein